jgi:hypothetical protein
MSGMVRVILKLRLKVESTSLAVAAQAAGAPFPTTHRGACDGGTKRARHDRLTPIRSGGRMRRRDRCATPLACDAQKREDDLSQNVWEVCGNVVRSGYE